MIVGASGDGIRNHYVDVAETDLAVAPPPGRRAEIGRLSSRLDAVAAGTGGVALISGEGGVGKTTLSAWVVEEARARGMVVLEAPCFELSVETPYACLVPAFGPVLRGERDLEPSALVEGLHSLGLLFDGLDTGGSLGGADPGDGLARSRLHGALATLVSRMSAHAPVVLAVDDLHWADPVSLEVLHGIAGDLPHVPLLIVATLRPFETSERAETRGLLRALRRAEWTCTIDVEGLDREGTRALVQGRLGSVFPTRVVDLVHRRSGGTPLVAEELLEVMVETGALRSVGRRWVFDAGDEIPTPAVAVDLIGDRLERLGPDAIHLVASIAVAGRPVGADVLAAVSSQDPASLVRHLEDLRRSGVIDRADTASGTEWIVHHPMIGEAAIGLLDVGALPAIHAAFVARSSGSVERRAHHIVGAGRASLRDEHVAVLVDAGRAALERGAPEETCRVAGFALDAIDDSVVGDERLFDVVWMLGVAWGRRGELGVATQHLERARRLARERGDVEAEAGVLVDLQQTNWDPRHDDVTFHAHAGDLLPRLEEAGSLRSAHRLLRTQIVSRLRAGDMDQLTDSVERLERIGGRLDDPGIQLWTRYARLLNPRTNFEDGRAQIAELDDLLGSVAGHPELHRRVLHDRLDLTLLVGHRDEIEQAIRDERELAECQGEVLTWRVGLATWDLAVAEGDLDRTMEVEHLMRLTGIQRPIGYLDAADAVSALFTGQPRSTRGAAVERPHPDIVLEQVLLHADQWRRPRDTDVARRALEHWAHRRFVAGMPLTGPVSAALAHLTLGDHAGFDAVVDLLERFDGGTGRTTAWARVLVGEASTGAGRADAHRDAARRFTALGRPFDAAVCHVTAAEAGGSVDDAELQAAYALFAAAPAPWMAERAAAVLGGPAASSSDGGGSRPVDDLGLTKREREVAEVVAEGLSNREVANRLFISVRTVTSHLDHIYTKLGIGSRRELADLVRARQGTDT